MPGPGLHQLYHAVLHLNPFLANTRDALLLQTPPVVFLPMTQPENLSEFDMTAAAAAAAAAVALPAVCVYRCGKDGFRLVDTSP